MPNRLLTVRDVKTFFPWVKKASLENPPKTRSSHVYSWYNRFSADYKRSYVFLTSCKTIPWCKNPVCGDLRERPHITLYIGHNTPNIHIGISKYLGQVKIGCQQHHIETWQKDYKTIAKTHCFKGPALKAMVEYIPKIAAWIKTEKRKKLAAKRIKKADHAQ